MARFTPRTTEREMRSAWWDIKEREYSALHSIYILIYTLPQSPFSRPGWGARGGGGCAGCLWARERYALFVSFRRLKHLSLLAATPMLAVVALCHSTLAAPGRELSGACDGWSWPPEDTLFCSSTNASSVCQAGEECACIASRCTCKDGEPFICTRDCQRTSCQPFQ